MTFALLIAASLLPGYHLAGPTALEVRGGTVAEMLDSLTRSLGSYWERDGRLAVVRRNLVRFYEIDYPQNDPLSAGEEQCHSHRLGASPPARPPLSTRWQPPRRGQDGKSEN